MKMFSGTVKQKQTAIKALSLIIGSLLLVSCASTRTVYAPAEEPGEVGYTERKIAENRYRVTFMGDHDASLAEVQDYALLRAAEVTLFEDYDYFEIESRSTVPVDDANHSATGAVAYRTPGASHTSCGLLGCETYRDPGTIVYEERFPDSRESYTTSLEIVMMASDSAAERAYNAREVINTLQ